METLIVTVYEDSHIISECDADDTDRATTELVSGEDDTFYFAAIDTDTRTDADDTYYSCSPFTPDQPCRTY